MIFFIGVPLLMSVASSEVLVVLFWCPSRLQGGFLLSRLISSICSDFVTEARAAEVETFFAEHSAPAANRAIKQACERVRRNVSWLERDGEAIAAFLRA